VSIYGQLITDTRVEQEVLACLSAWLPSYLQEVARQDGDEGNVALPKSYETIRDSPTKWTEQQLPAIVVHVGGTMSTSRRGGYYRVVYGCEVAAVVAGQSRVNTRKIASIYSLAIAAALVQHGGLSPSVETVSGDPIPGFADGVEWQDTQYDSIDEDRSRTIMAAIVSLDIAVNAVIDVFSGPVLPPDPPDVIPGLPDYGPAQEVDTAIVNVPIGAPLP
jgi:hypothetical protein